ncbi:tripartite tricarboxylate transporter TctB family protein [Nesterenkonia sphaerica]|uniref:DUF1468 domain-containing protein n=1 Tax=Nesterenkonia sphaerica TaxID=1804988 RepID=A0A5R8ZZF4_9MICC|nr:tripartite tricarboxylate transporter TctB family protein [Nesterenkonia sphaerica]TLP71215.1 hypothetical protein FEF27_12630 [Nesterenkonia sphaerica]
MSSIRTTEGTNRHLPALSDVLIGVVSLLIFGAALLATLDWPIEAARFPRFISGIGLLCTLLFLGTLAFRSLTTGPTVTQDTEGGPQESQTTEDPADEESVDVGYVFASAGAKEWVQTLLWLGAFFLLTYLFGVYIAGVTFAFLYLKYGASKSLVYCLVYSVVLGGSLWMLFSYFLGLPLPSGIFDII